MDKLREDFISEKPEKRQTLQLKELTKVYEIYLKLKSDASAHLIHTNRQI